MLWYEKNRSQICCSFFDSSWSKVVHIHSINLRHFKAPVVERQVDLVVVSAKRFKIGA